MRVILVMFALCTQPALGFTQDLDDFFLSKPHENGTLYHVKEIELKTSEKSELKVDYTYLRTEAADSVRVLLLLKSKSTKGKPNSVSFSFSERKILWDDEGIQLLYVDKEKKYWTTRVELSMSELEFMELLKAGFYQIEWQTEDGNFNASLPKKYREDYQEFAELLKYNN
jgi:hypothetical protein